MYSILRKAIDVFQAVVSDAGCSLITPQTDALNCDFWLECAVTERRVCVRESEPAPSSFPGLAGGRAGPCLVPHGVFWSLLWPAPIITTCPTGVGGCTHLFDMLSQLGVLPEDLGFQYAQPWVRFVRILVEDVALGDGAAHGLSRRLAVLVRDPNGSHETWARCRTQP